MVASDEKPAIRSCKDPRPASAEGRLTEALRAVNSALECVDLRGFKWAPVAGDGWERARDGLHRVRDELTAALAAWRSYRKGDEPAS